MKKYILVEELKDGLFKRVDSRSTLPKIKELKKIYERTYHKKYKVFVFSKSLAI